MPGKKPLYQSIVDHFIQQIEGGQLVPGSKLPSEKELMDFFGVSRITVIKALDELSHSSHIYRVKGKGSFVSENSKNDVRIDGSSANGALEDASMKIFSVVLPYSEQIGYEILRGAEKEFEKIGGYVTTHNSEYKPDREREIIQKLRADKVRGIIIYPCSSEHNIDLFGDMLIDGFPFVMIDRDIKELHTPHVYSNNFQGSYDIVSYLIGLGHRHIAFVCSRLREVTSIFMRYRGYCMAQIDAGITLQPELLISDLISSDDPAENNPSEYPEPHFLAASRVIERLMSLKQPPTAIVADNDYSAMFLMKAAMKMGISIPSQLSITGFDNLPFSNHMDVPLTTVEQSFTKMGEMAARMLIEREGGLQTESNEVILKTSIVIRESTAAPRSEKIYWPAHSE
ncbi:GntR family transcriptional regulator [Cohnella nanjingensis]|uniref:GntR family transcriptional regulator n=1 Tax=Cohnella nanjingensis TaxID=1387779 RepID=A0A7X0VIJ6_9BACL|nr:GntR family transcriptional regulator [Cohnella nanjingensis]MBB6674618.1 GntR family transcriptional regulator [Cohnella nanjingensis]